MKKFIRNVKIGIGIGICSLLFCEVSFGAVDFHITQPQAGQEYVTVIDVTSGAGTNTTNRRTVALHGAKTVEVQLVPTSVSIGTISYGIEISMDDVSYGSITACEMVRTTNTLVTTQSAATGTDTEFFYAPKYGGTHTSVFGGTFSVGSNTSQFYKITPLVGDFLRFQSTHLLSGTDTGHYKILVKKGS